MSEVASILLSPNSQVTPVSSGQTTGNQAGGADGEFAARLAGLSPNTSLHTTPAEQSTSTTTNSSPVVTNSTETSTSSGLAQNSMQSPHSPGVAPPPEPSGGPEPPPSTSPRKVAINEPNARSQNPDPKAKSSTKESELQTTGSTPKSKPSAVSSASQSMTHGAVIAPSQDPLSKQIAPPTVVTSPESPIGYASTLGLANPGDGFANNLAPKALVAYGPYKESAGTQERSISASSRTNTVSKESLDSMGSAPENVRGVGATETKAIVGEGQAIPVGGSGSNQTSANASTSQLMNLGDLKTTNPDIVSIHSVATVVSTIAPNGAVAEIASQISSPQMTSPLVTSPQVPSPQVPSPQVPSPLIASALAAGPSRVDSSTSLEAGKGSTVRPQEGNAGGGSVAVVSISSNQRGSTSAQDGSSSKSGSDTSQSGKGLPKSTVVGHPSDPISPASNLEIGPSLEATPRATMSEASRGIAVQTANGSIDRAVLTQDVATRIHNLAVGRAADGVVVHLEPQNFGSLTLVVKTLATGVQAQISASNDQVREALQQSQPELGQALTQRGMQLSHVSISSSAPSPATPSSGSATNFGTGANGSQPGWSENSNQSHRNSSFTTPRYSEEPRDSGVDQKMSLNSGTLDVLI